MKKKLPVFGTLFGVVLFLTALQAASAESFLYFFKKTPTDSFSVVEAVQEEKLSGFLKLTTKDGKAVAWQENMMVAKFGLFDEGAGTPEQSSLETYVAGLEDFMAKEPGSVTYLKPIVDKWKTHLVQAKVQAEDTVRKNAEERLSRFLTEEYKTDQSYSLEMLEAKTGEGTAISGLLPEKAAEITQYVKPWAEELTNRKAGLERFEGKWLSADAVAQIKAERLAAVRKDFLQEHLAFQITSEAFSQNTVYLSVGALGISTLFFAVIFLGGMAGLFKTPSMATWCAILVGGGGLVLYGFGTWLLLQDPSVHEGTMAVLEKGSEKGSTGPLALDDLIFLIHQPAGSNAAEAPAQLLIQDPSVNAFLKNYVKMDPGSKPQDLAVLRKGIKIQVRNDCIVIFDQMCWMQKDLVVSYTLYFTKVDNVFQFGKTEASVGNLPLPNRVFSHLWSQMEPLMRDVLVRSKVMENYYVKSMEPGVVEIVSTRSALRQASR